MYRYLLLILTTCALFSCHRRVVSTKSQVIEVRDSIIYERDVQIIDTTIYVPGDSVRIVDTIPCPEAKMNREVVSKNGKTSARVVILDGIVTVDCKTDSLQLLVQMLRRELVRTANFKSKKQDTSVYEQKQDWYIPRWILWTLAISLLLNVIAYRSTIFSFLKKFV